MRIALFLAVAASLALASCVVREVRHCPGPYPECGDMQMAGTEPTRVESTRRSPGLPIGEPGETYASTYPPEPLVESVPALDDGEVWVDGYWHWNGAEWVWISGQSVYAPGDDYVYVEPSYDVTGGYCVYTPGYWQTYTALPSSVVVVRDRYRPPRVRHRRRSHLRDRRTFGQADTSVVVSGDRRPRRPYVRDRRGKRDNDSPRPHVRDRRDLEPEPLRPERDRFGRVERDRGFDRVAPRPRPRPGFQPRPDVTTGMPASSAPGASRPDRVAPRRPRIPPRPAVVAPSTRAPIGAPSTRRPPRIHRPGVSSAPSTRPAPPRIHRPAGIHRTPRSRPGFQQAPGARPAPRFQQAPAPRPAPRGRPARSAPRSDSGSRARPSSRSARPATSRSRPSRRR